MAVTTSSTLSNSLRVQYLNDYQAGAMRRRFYDIIASPIDELSAAAGAAQSMADLAQGGTVRIPFLSGMAVNTTPLSEVQDITPQLLADAKTDVLVDMYGDGIQTSQKALIQYFTNYGTSSPEKVGENMSEFQDFKAYETGLAGNLVLRGAARSSLDAGTTAHRASDSTFSNVAARLSQFNCPGWEGENRPTNWVALTDHFVLNDIVQGGNVVNVAIYQDGEIVLNNEVGRLSQFKIVASGFAKIFYGAGATSDTVATTLAVAAARLAKTIVVGAIGNIATDMWLNLYENEETGDTFYPMNERVKVTAISGTTVTIVGGGDNGGLRFARALGDTVEDDDSAHTILYGGPRSLAKVFAPEIGPMGELVGPKKQGLAEQWTSFAWKHYIGYGRPSENWLHRAEVSVSEEV